MLCVIHVEIYTDPGPYFVQMEKGQSKNLMCIRPSSKYPIQWLKVFKIIDPEVLSLGTPTLTSCLQVFTPTEWERVYRRHLLDPQLFRFATARH